MAGPGNRCWAAAAAVVRAAVVAGLLLAFRLEELLQLLQVALTELVVLEVLTLALAELLPGLEGLHGAAIGGLEERVHVLHLAEVRLLEPAIALSLALISIRLLATLRLQLLHEPPFHASQGGFFKNSAQYLLHLIAGVRVLRLRLLSRTAVAGLLGAAEHKCGIQGHGALPPAIYALLLGNSGGAFRSGLALFSLANGQTVQGAFVKTLQAKCKIFVTGFAPRNVPTEGKSCAVANRLAMSALLYEAEEACAQRQWDVAIEKLEAALQEIRPGTTCAIVWRIVTPSAASCTKWWRRISTPWACWRRWGVPARHEGLPPAS